MAWPNPNKLLVEGIWDQRVIPELIEANGIRWGESRAEWIVEINVVGGIEKLFGHPRSGCRRQAPQQQSKFRVQPPVLPGLSTFHAVYWLDSG